MKHLLNQNLKEEDILIQYILLNSRHHEPAAWDLSVLVFKRSKIYI
jgi:hypothetical protein